MLKLPSVKARGFYRVEVLRADGSTKSDTGLFPNLITSAGAARILAGWSEFAAQCVAGTGTTPPTVGDTKLVNQVMAVGSGVPSFDKQVTTKPWYSSAQKVFTFPAATQNYTIGELGVSNVSGAVVICSRALPRDTTGAVTTISVLQGEILRVTYVMRMYFDMNKYEGSFEADGVTYNYVAMADRMDDSQFWQVDFSMAFNPDPSGCQVGQHPADTKWINEGLINQKLDKTYESNYSVGVTPEAAVPHVGAKAVWRYKINLATANYPKGLNVIRFGHSRGNYRSGPSYSILLDKYLPKTADMTLEIDIDCDYQVNTP